MGVGLSWQAYAIVIEPPDGNYVDIPISPKPGNAGTRDGKN